MIFKFTEGNLDKSECNLDGVLGSFLLCYPRLFDKYGCQTGTWCGSVSVYSNSLAKLNLSCPDNLLILFYYLIPSLRGRIFVAIEFCTTYFFSEDINLGCVL